MKYLKKFENHTEYEGARKNLILPNVSLCAQENEVYYNPIHDQFNGHAYVDLGLPSGTLWATMNVGANSPTDYGLYFAWGETQGYTSGTRIFSEENYKYYDGSNYTKYNATDGKLILDLEDDAANVNWGGDWQIPTYDQWQELKSNSTYSRQTVDGVNGLSFTSTINGETLFFPFAGCILQGASTVYDNGRAFYSYGSNSDNNNGCSGVYYNIYGLGVVNNDLRYRGYTIRGIVVPKK